MDNDAWQAMDAVITEYLWVENEVGWIRPQVVIYWPYGDWPSTTGYWIDLPDKAVAGWDHTTIYHEYGHCIMFSAYGDGWPPTSASGTHYVFSEMDGGFALIEGWAEFMECAVDNDPDNLADWFNGHGGNIEANDWYNCIDTGDMDGDIIEGSVASILWDIFDPFNDDGLSMGFDEIWTIIGVDNPSDIHAFWNQWLTNGYGQVIELNKIYWNYGIEKITETVTFYTNPSEFGALTGSITFNGDTYEDAQSETYIPDDYTATANAPTGYQFHHWEYDNTGQPGVGVYVPNIAANPTTVEIWGDGWLKAVFEALITFRTEPSNVGSISYGGNVYSDGQSIWEVNLPPDYTNIVTITANPSDEYIFSHWEPTGQIWVDSTTSITTDLTVNGPGVLTAVFERVLEIDYIMTTDYVEKDWGEYGDTMVVLGSGATAGAAVNLYWDIVAGPNAYLLNTTLANPDGTFEVWFNVPEAVNGSHYLWVEDTATGEHSSWGPFSVVPTITLDVENGSVGKVVTASGSGFKEGTVDNITINGVFCTIIDAIAIDDVGKFTGAFVIPSVENVGIHGITLTDSNGLEANSDFLITGLADISLNPKYGSPGTTVSVHGYNYSAIQGETVSIELWDKDPLEWRMDLETFTTDADGEFSGSLIIPVAPFDDYLMLAVQDQYNINATCDFRLGIIAMIINPTRGPTGTQVQITGIGFTPFGEWNATFGDIPIFQNEPVDESGMISDVFNVPEVEPGTYFINVTDGETEIEVYTLFDVIPPGPYAIFNFDEYVTIRTDGDSVPSGLHESRSDTYLEIRNKDDEFDEVLGGLSYQIEAGNIENVNWDEYADWSSTQSNWTFPTEHSLLENEQENVWSSVTGDIQLNTTVTRWMNQTIFSEDGYQRVNYTVSFTENHPLWSGYEGLINVETDQYLSATIVPGSFSTDAPLDYYTEEFLIIEFVFNRFAIENDVDYNFTFVTRIDLEEWAIPPIVYKPEIILYKNLGQGFELSDEAKIGVIPPEALPDYIYSAQVSTNITNVWWQYWNRDLSIKLARVEESLSPLAQLYFYDSSSFWTDEDTLSAGEHNISSDVWLDIWNRDDDSDTVLGDLSYYVEADNITWVYWGQYADWTSSSSNWTFPSEYYIEEDGSHSVDFQLGERPVSLNFSLERWMNETTFSEDGYQRANFTVSFTNTDSPRCYGYIRAWESWGVNVSFVPGSIQTDAPLEYINEDLNWIYFNFNMSSLLAGVDYNFTVVVKVDLTGEIAPPVLYKPGFTVVNNIDYGYASGGVGYVAEMPPEALPDYLYTVRVSTNTSNGWELSWSRALQGYLNASTRYISAEIILDVSEGPVGSIVEVNGTGFTPEGNITRISIDSLNCTIIGAVDIDTDGNFSTSIVIPSVNNTGAYDIEVVDDGERSATVSFEVSGRSEVEIDPFYCPPGTTVRVHGYNYSAIPGETVSIELWDKDPLEWRMDLETFTTDADGEFSGSLIIPAAPFDDYLILAVQGLYNINATCDFKLGIIAMIINPTSGPTGTQVQITGTGFTPYGEWNATIGDTPIFTNETVSGDEQISETFFVPNLDIGTYNVTVLDVDTGIALTTEFVVTDTAEIHLDPVEAPSGYNVTIGGRYFTAEEDTGLEFVIYNSTGAWPMDVRQGNPGTPAVTDSDGNFTAWWIVPQLTAGDYIVNVTDAEEIWAQREFTARAPEIISISVDPGDIDFGTIYEGGSGTSSVTITNDGNVEVSVIATLGSEVPVGFYTSNFKLDDLAVSSWSINNLGPGASEPVALRIDIPVSTEPGSKTAILIFWAEIP